MRMIEYKEDDHEELIEYMHKIIKYAQKVSECLKEDGHRWDTDTKFNDNSVSRAGKEIYSSRY